tara:strand:- start:2127 stop:2699 length:573 start_codon:yes stop_codon:yes gene_type:complete
MSDIKFFKEYSNKTSEIINFNDSDLKIIQQIYKKFININKTKNKLIFLGNGGSAAISSHVSVDLTKNAKIRSTCFNESDLITCLSNDYGYEKWMAKALEFYAIKGDTVIIISSSGESKNVLLAAQYCLKNNIDYITLTGNKKNNKLIKKNKKGLNLWVNSKSYNIIEMTHLFALLMIIDKIIGKLEYKNL